MTSTRRTGSRKRTPVRSAVALSLSFLLPALGACYSYLPIETSMLERGDRVRVRLSQPADQPLRLVTARDIVVVNGDVASVTDTALVLSAWDLESVTGAEFAGEGWTVYVAPDNIALLEQRNLEGLQTGLVVGAGVAGLLVIGALVISGGSGGDGNGNGGPPPPEQ